MILLPLLSERYQYIGVLKTFKTESFATIVNGLAVNYFCKLFHMTYFCILLHLTGF